MSNLYQRIQEKDKAIKAKIAQINWFNNDHEANCKCDECTRLVKNTMLLISIFFLSRVALLIYYGAPRTIWSGELFVGYSGLLIRHVIHSIQKDRSKNP